MKINMCKYCIATDYGDFEPEVWACKYRYCDEAYDVMKDMENDKTWTKNLSIKRKGKNEDYN